MTPAGFELALPDWEPGVLTTRRRCHIWQLGRDLNPQPPDRQSGVPRFWTTEPCMVTPAYVWFNQYFLLRLLRCAWYYKIMNALPKNAILWHFYLRFFAQLETRRGRLQIPQLSLICLLILWWHLRDLNPALPDWKSGVLTIRLRCRIFPSVRDVNRLSDLLNCLTLWY